MAILLITGTTLAGAKGQGGFAITTPFRGLTRAGGSGNAALSWSTFALNLTGTTLAGGKGSAGLVPPETLLGGRTRAGALGNAALIDTSFLPIFPTLPVGFPVTVKPVMANVVGQIPVGRDMRAPEQRLPIWEIDLNFEELRDQTQNSVPYSELAGFTDFTQLVQLFLASVGQYGQFLFDAPWDDSRADQIIGTGDGTTKTFFMVRTWGFGVLAFTEPVGAVNSVLNVKINGVVLSPAFWTIIDRNILTFATAPANNAVITSTFSYYYRCQWAEDQQPYEEFFKDRWTAKVKMRSVFPQLPGYLAMLPTLLSPGPFPPTPIPSPPSPTCTWGTPTVLAGLAGGGGASLNGLSDDGTIALGSCETVSGAGTYSAVTWTNLSAPVVLPFLYSTDEDDYAAAISADNSKIFGYTNDTTSHAGHAVVWESGIVTDMGALAPDNNVVGVSACNAAGTMVVGESAVGTIPHACLWTYTLGVWSVTNLGTLPGGQGSYALGMSRDGTTIVGQADDPSDGNTRACYWQLVGGVWTIYELPFTGLAGPGRKDAAGGAYGSIIVGYLDSAQYPLGGNVTAVEWNSGVLTTLPGLPTAQAICISSNGALIGGQNADVDGYIHGAVWLSGSPNTMTQLPDEAGYDGSQKPEVAALSADGEVAGGNTFGSGLSAPLIWKCT